MTKTGLLSFAIVAMFVAQPSLRAQETVKPSTPAMMSSAYGEKLKIQGVPNPGKINDGLYRGAQPSALGLEALKKLGITTVIDLRAEDPGKADWEKNEVEHLGMRFVHIPIGRFAAPRNEDVAQFLTVVRNSDPQQKVFVHCEFGEDRTGVFIATYRMGIQKWPVQQTFHEMYNFGFNGMWHPAMKAFVRDFPARLSSAPALAPLQDPKSPSPVVPATKSN
jgi:tyrosine-protein phosphatase SIW14